MVGVMPKSIRRGDPPYIASHIKLMLIIVVFETVPEVDVTVTVPGPFKVDLDAVVQPASPAMVTTSSPNDR